MITTAPTTVISLISLKGRLHEFGPSLERAPANLVYIGRRMTMGGWRLPASDWANPFTIRQCGSAEAAVARYAEWADRRYELMRRVADLRGCVLACWCGEGSPCHGHHLASLADGRPM